jgi:hypothetical protein
MDQHGHLHPVATAGLARTCAVPKLAARALSWRFSGRRQYLTLDNASPDKIDI